MDVKGVKTMGVPLRPVGDNVVVIKNPTRDETTRGGIILPNEVQKEQPTFQVVAVGEGRINPDGSRRTMVFKSGDVVLIKRSPAIPFVNKGVYYYVTRDEDIVAYVDEEDAEERKKELEDRANTMLFREVTDDDAG